jgi:multidrug efflux pump subunit AcrB
MKKILEIFVKYHIYSWIILLIILLGGVFGVLSMKMSFFPERTSRNITVSVFYPGASPKEMEEGITVRIEEAIRGIVGIKEMSSSSSENFANVLVVTTGEYNLDETLAEVKNAVDGISGLPVDAERPIVYKQRSQTRSMFMEIYGDVDLITLKKYAYDVEADLLASGIVSQLRMHGYPKEEISVEIKERDLLRYNIKFDDVARAIASNNADISAGQIKSMKEEILIRSRTRSVDPNVIGNIIIRGDAQGGFIRVRDIADVKRKFEDVTKSTKLNGKQSISFEVMKLPEEDLKKISDFVKEYEEEFNIKHPEVHLEVTFDFYDMLLDRISLLTRNGAMGLVLVLIALGLFLNTRLAFWVAIGIPVSFLAMFMVAGVYGLTINMMSLFGMILVIGILVDDGIVIGENIFNHYERGATPRRAAIDGTLEMVPAVLTSVTTTIVAFIPIMMIRNGHMEMMKDMAFVVVFALAFSLVEAFLLLPSHLSTPIIGLPRKEKRKLKPFRKKLNAGIDFLRSRIYGVVLKFVIRWRWFVLFVPTALFLITAGLLGGGFIKFTIFPNMAWDTFNVNIAFTPGTGEAKTQEYLEKFEKIIWTANDSLMRKNNDTLPYVKYTSLSLGSGFSGAENGSHAGAVEVFFHNMEKRSVGVNDVSELVRQMIGPIPEADKYSIGGMERFGKPVSISIRGKNLSQLEAASDELLDSLITLTSLKNIMDSNPLGKQEVRLKLKDKAYMLGMTQAQVAAQIRQGFYGGQAQRLQSGKDELRVWVRYPDYDRMNLGQLEKMKIKTQFGEYPLSEIAEYTIERGPVNIKRFNYQREIRVEADLIDASEPLPPILEVVTSGFLPGIMEKYPSVQYELMGQSKGGDESFQEMIVLFIIAILVIIFIIIIHFRSFMQAFMIMSMIPLGWLGAAWGHGIEGVTISMLSAFGMVALSGVIINDAVVFLTKYNSLMKKGYKIEDAIFATGKARFRAILLTTITTSAGLYPLIMETSFQAQFLIPMAVTLAYGVLVGTGFILLFFPVMILTWNDLRRGLYWMFTGKSISAEEIEVAVKHAKIMVDNGDDEEGAK